MRVAVGIPSYQESDSISNVVVQVDRGLSRLLDPSACVIVNVDGNSSDGTTGVFLKTPTQCKKQSLVITDRPGGKGRNVFAFFRYCLEHEVEALGLVDADVQTVEPDWMNALLLPLINRSADYVAPLYRRNRFEGATTNHFAYPLLFGYFGEDVRQPIGGEFGLSASMVQYLLQQPVEEPELGYGIDIFMTMHAVGAGFKLAQVNLGKKLHKPSFPKRSRIFRDVAATAIKVARQYQFRVSHRVASLVFSSIDDSQDYAHHRQAQELAAEMRIKSIALIPVYQSWIGEGSAAVTNALAAVQPQMSAQAWTELLAAGMSYAVWQDPFAFSEEFVERLTPAYLIRSLTFWNENWRRAPEEVEEEIVMQARLFREKLKKRAQDELII